MPHLAEIYPDWGDFHREFFIPMYRASQVDWDATTEILEALEREEITAVAAVAGFREIVDRQFRKLIA